MSEKKRYLILDSGTGGLSVGALALRAWEAYPASGKSAELIFANVAPSNEQGYNQIETEPEKVALFDKTLRALVARYDPVEVYVACHTLSTLLPHCRYFQENPHRIKSIVTIGVAAIEAWQQKFRTGTVLLYATDTTIASGRYQSLVSSGQQNLVWQPCPGLATDISNDLEGDHVSKTIQSFVGQSLQQVDVTDPVACFLGCTHYGYRAEAFQKALHAFGWNTILINSNEAMAQELYKALSFEEETSAISQVSITCVSRYALPESEQTTHQHFLKSISPMAAIALQNNHVLPDLF